MQSLRVKKSDLHYLVRRDSGMCRRIALIIKVDALSFGARALAKRMVGSR